MTKKISKVIVYYEDGTYQEIAHSVPDVQSEKDKEHVSPSPVTPDLRPDTQKIQEWPIPRPPWTPSPPYQPYYSPFTSPGTATPPGWRPGEIWCTTNTSDNIPLNYSVSVSPDPNMVSWSFTSTGNADNLNKYTITSTGNGNVDLSK